MKLKSVKKTAAPAPTAAMAKVETLTAAIATTEAQRTTASDTLTTLRRRLEDAQQRRDAARVPALATGEPVAREEYAQASADARKLEDEVAEHERLVAQLATDIASLQVQHAAARQEATRAQNAALAPLASAALRKVQRGVELITEGAREHRTVHLQMVQNAADAGLPQAEMDRLHYFPRVVRWVQWHLGTIRLMPRPTGSHYLEDTDPVAIAQSALARGAESPARNDAA